MTLNSILKTNSSRYRKYRLYTTIIMLSRCCILCFVIYLKSVSQYLCVYPGLRTIAHYKAFLSNNISENTCE